MKFPTISVLVSICALIAAVFGGMQFIGWPPYAPHSELLDLSEQVQANTEASLLQQLENALRRGDQQAIRRLCNAVQKLYGYKPAGCP